MKYLLCCILFFSLIKSYSQVLSENKRAQKYYQTAGRLIGDKRYSEALGQLQLAIQEDPAFAAAYQRKGDINRKLKDYKQASDDYRKVLALNPALSKLTLFGYAESLFFQGFYGQATNYFENYLSSGNLRSESRALVQKYLDDCKFSVEALKKVCKIDRRALSNSVNTRQDEYLPSVTADKQTLLFTRRQGENEDLYISYLKNGIWESAVELPGKVNTAAYNEGSECISADGHYLFFTGCDIPGGLGRCDIYISHREEGGWSSPYNPGAPLNSAAWDAQPSISSDGRTLYFVSNRPGGYGGYDVWYSQLGADGRWQVPQNAGPRINSAYDEHSPFLHHDGQTLYFSSNGWPGFGNRDIFLSRRDSAGNWGLPLNLGWPINSPDEESSLIVTADAATAYYAARDSLTKDMNLYSFTLPLKFRPGAVRYFKGIVLDAESGQQIASRVEVRYVGNKRVLYSNELADGSFLFTVPDTALFDLNVSARGYDFVSRRLKSDNREKDSVITVMLQKLRPGKKFSVEFIFFESNSSVLSPASDIALQQLTKMLLENPGLKLEINGHTDDQGGDDFNKKLSLARARAVYQYLLKHGIGSTRLAYKGLGYSEPRASNKTPEGRAKNRRTEFVVTGI